MSKIEEFLKSLGETSEEVASSLVSMGIKGEKCNGKFCPIIKAIYKKFPNMSTGLTLGVCIQRAGYRNLGVYGHVYMERSRSIRLTWNDTQTIDPRCPAPVQKFVDDFDNGLYPHLIGSTVEEVKERALSKLTEEERLALKC